MIVQGRLSGKQFADTSTVTYTYENTTSRLKSVTDALSQVKTYGYAKDNRLTAITYTGALHTTPNVSFTWDPYFPRLTSMTDGTGTRQYNYVSVGSLGALQLQQESGPLVSSAISYAYDALGRLSSRTVQGAGAETFGYDAIGPLSGHSHDMGAFTLAYLGQTGQITSRTLASSTLATSWSYLANASDRRLSGISNTGLTAGQFSNYTYTTTQENFISGISETSDAAAVYPPAGTQTATYNNLNQLTNLSGQALTFDAVGNVTSDGTRNYTWDAENRLVGISYPGVSGKATAFTYDGLGRRATISSTPAGGGSPTVTSYLWCADTICQARNASNTTIRSYYDEGELVPGTPNQPYYYGIDQLGSVRRAFASSTSAPAYSYDPYGVPLQATAPVTDFVYAGMFYNADSGLYLTKHRAFDPVAGRLLSRDRVGESSDPLGNLYPYVGGNPISLVDPNGDNPIVIAFAVGAAAGFAINVATQLINNGGQFGCVNWGAAVNAATWGGIYGVAGEALLAAVPAGGAARALAAVEAPVIAKSSTQLGVEGEAAVRGTYNIGDKVRINTGGGTIVPDGYIPGQNISEVKNVSSLSFTNQLRAYLDFATKNGLRFDLYTRPTTTFSGPLQDAIDSGLIYLLDIPQ